MTLSSPHYPKWYNADGLGCEWLLSAPEGFIIALEFIHFDVSMLELDLLEKYVVRLHAKFFCIFSYMKWLLMLSHCMMEFVIYLKN